MAYTSSARFVKVRRNTLVIILVKLTVVSKRKRFVLETKKNVPTGGHESSLVGRARLPSSSGHNSSPVRERGGVYISNLKRWETTRHADAFQVAATASATAVVLFFSERGVCMDTGECGGDWNFIFLLKCIFHVQQRVG